MKHLPSFLIYYIKYDTQKNIGLPLMHIAPNTIISPVPINLDKLTSPA